MEAERHIVSLELAKVLSEVGVKKDSKFYWLNYKVRFDEMGCPEYYNHGEWSVQDFLPSEHAIKYFELKLEWFNAYLCSELGEVITSMTGLVGFPTWDGFTKRWVILWNGQIHEQDELEVNARAKMIIFLKVNGIGQLG